MKIMLDNKNAKIPMKAHDDDGGFDLFAPEGTYIEPNSSVVIDTGVHVQLPPNTAGFLVSKSGLNINHGLTSHGLVDVGYIGSIRVKLYNHKSSGYYVQKGDKISQLVVLPIVPIKNSDLEVVEEFAPTERGDNGFGSTGR
jgi:dUTP pyrophosphatase